MTNSWFGIEQPVLSLLNSYLYTSFLEESQTENQMIKKILFTSLMSISIISYGQQNELAKQQEDIVKMEQKAHRYIGQNLLSSVPDNYDLKYHRFQWQV